MSLSIARSLSHSLTRPLTRSHSLSHPHTLSLFLPRARAAASCQGATRGGPRSQGHLGAHAGTTTHRLRRPRCVRSRKLACSLS
eukprot:249040-Pleurochrysis_carterae.AAC.2